MFKRGDLFLGSTSLCRVVFGLNVLLTHYQTVQYSAFPRILTHQ